MSEQIDERQEAVDWVAERAQRYRSMNKAWSTERAIDEAMKAWFKSVERLQLKKRMEDEARATGAPTLRVSLGSILGAKRGR